MLAKSRKTLAKSQNKLSKIAENVSLEAKVSKLLSVKHKSPRISKTLVKNKPEKAILEAEESKC